MSETNAWYRQPAAPTNDATEAAARTRQGHLTKPPGALGRLEDLAVRLAGMQGRERPAADSVQITVFAADHGIAAAGVSAFRQSVTAAMVANMAEGGAAISVLAEQIGATVELVVLGAVDPVPEHPRIRNEPIARGTADLSQTAAMTSAELEQALACGRAAALRAVESGAELFIGGEMGIGNTTAATALACALLGRPAADLVGPGTGLDADGVERKRRLIDQALVLHRLGPEDPISPIRALAQVGGLEIAALAGACCACAQHGIPVLVDGFIASTSALAAVRLCPGAKRWLILSHASAEPGHRHVADSLGQRPLLELGMRLGEGSGAAIAVPLLRLACALHNDMATFAESGVPGAG
jgi:nicotinate-nucleotide--dimethylbenzimidazole phosphoribosyltransferase